MAIEIGLDTSQLTGMEKKLINIAQKSFPKDTTKFMKKKLVNSVRKLLRMQGQR